MIVVDTSAWIEWMDDSVLAEKIQAVVPPDRDCIVPTIVQLELMKWLAREVSRTVQNAMLAHLSRCQIVVMDSEIALLAAEFCSTAKLSTADAIVYATARHYGADLLTCDGHFKNLPRVVYIPKAGN